MPLAEVTFRAMIALTAQYLPDGHLGVIPQHPGIVCWIGQGDYSSGLRVQNLLTVGDLGAGQEQDQL